MRGAERVNVDLLASLWGQLGEALHRRAAEHEEGVDGYLRSCHSVWHVAGRVCLHVAENKRDPARPFAFLATYARVGRQGGKVRHVPLRRALKEYAGAGNRARLVALLSPLQRAAQDSEVIAALVRSGDVYHPLAWTPDEAYAFLHDAEGFERSGLVVRLPDWWSPKRQRRPAVTVTVGDTAPSSLGVGAMLNVDLSVTLGGETLSEEEIAELISAGSGLVMLKGRWVEADAEKLSQVLDHWRQVQDQAEQGTVSFAQAMRMLSGTEEDEGTQTRPEWSQVVAGAWLGRQLDALRSPEVMAEIDENAGLRAVLRPYQKLGVQWLWTLHGLGLGGCLADDMGLGKTIQVIGLMSLVKAAGQPGTDILVVPASLIENWRSEIARFAPGLSALIAHPSQIPSRKLKALDPGGVARHDVVITTYGTAMRTPWMHSYRWRSVVLDEAQAIKNPAAKQTRAIKSFQAQWRVALTGTPVENRLGDLWSIFDFLNPGLLGTAKAFGKACVVMSRARHDGYAPLRRLVGPYILRRLKTDRAVISDLPDKTEMSSRCLLSKLQAALYQQAVRELEDALANAQGIQRRGIILAYLMRFKQICNHPSQWLGDDKYDPCHSGKFHRLAALCEPIAQRQEKVLVFSQFRTMIAPLRRHLSRCFGADGLVLHGGTPVKRRQGLVQRFQDDEEVPFMVLSLKAGGTGLNLTAANHVVHFDRWWNPAVENQATDRAYRIGQRRNVLVHKFVCQGTIEERIDMMITSKQQLSEQVLSGGGEVTLTELTNKQLVDMVRLDIHSAVTS